MTWQRRRLSRARRRGHIFSAHLAVTRRCQAAILLPLDDTRGVTAPQARRADLHDLPAPLLVPDHVDRRLQYRVRGRFRPAARGARDARDRRTTIPPQTAPARRPRPVSRRLRVAVRPVAPSSRRGRTRRVFFSSRPDPSRVLRVAAGPVLGGIIVPATSREPRSAPAACRAGVALARPSRSPAASRSHDPRRSETARRAPRVMGVMVAPPPPACLAHVRSTHAPFSPWFVISPCRAHRVCGFVLLCVVTSAT